MRDTCCKFMMSLFLKIVPALYGWPLVSVAVYGRLFFILPIPLNIVLNVK